MKKLITHAFVASTFFLLSFSTVLAQKSQGSIAGVVTNANGGAVPHATVLVEKAVFRSAADAYGKFTITRLPAGEYTITVSSVGYQSKTSKVVVLDGRTTETTIELQEESNNMAEVEVIAKSEAQEIEESGFNVNAIETKTIANATADLHQVLNRTTGIRIREQGGLGSDFNFSLNGLSGSAIKFFIDGVPMENFGSSMSLNNVPVNLVERIEVYKGVVPVWLGSDALGGAVNIVTNQRNKSFADVSYSYGSFNTNRASISAQYTGVKSGFTVRTNGFFNYSDNDYVMRNDPQQKVVFKVNEALEIKDVKRFHDRYTSGMLQVETGIVHKKWADQLLVGLLHSESDKEIQIGPSIENPIGEAKNKNGFNLYSLKYSNSKLIKERLSVALSTSFSSEKSIVLDTASRLYYWDGSFRKEDNAGGEFGGKQLYHYKNENWIGIANLAYKLNEHHSFNVNANYNHLSRSGYDEMDIGKELNGSTTDLNLFEKPNTLGKSIIGVSYRADLLDSKLNASVFGKLYHYNVFFAEAAYISVTEGYYKVEKSNSNAYGGYGMASSYKLFRNLCLKASYEYTYRLPEAFEVFGDGVFVLANTELKPESSHNFNFGVFSSRKFGKHRLSAEAGAFHREASDFISLFSDGGRFSLYKNVYKLRIQGLDGEVRYDYRNLLRISLNASYQNALDNQEFKINSQAKNINYKRKLPNQPYAYGNAEVTVGKENVLGKNSRTQLSLFYRYVHAYYLTWSALGSKPSKDVIPSQQFIDASLSHSMGQGKYNVSLETFNLTDEFAYDNFKRPKPGRTFSIKVRCFISTLN